MTRLILAAALVMALSPAAGAQTNAPDTPRDKDVVVESTRIPLGKLPTQTRPGTYSGVRQRVVYENSERIAKCAMKTSLPKLRTAIDGAVNSAEQRFAQAWLIRRTAGCNTDAAINAREEWDEGNMKGAAMSSLEDGVTGAETESNRSVAGKSVYDRGALMERAMRTYAPDLSLTDAETRDAAVQQRFDLRERFRNGYREPKDLDYFRVAVCIVRMRPEAAVRLYRAGGASRNGGRLQALLINDTRACVGNAKKVYVDSTQFRLYVIDALYRWVIAARDVPSLLPAEQVAER